MSASTAYRLSLPVAILININIMLGSGIFINIVNLAQRAGVFAPLAYMLVSFLMLPLVLSMAWLVNEFPDGGVYTYGDKALSSFWGFISAWSYFVGKLASAMLVIHISMMLMSQMIYPLSAQSTLMLDIFVLSLFVGLNMFNIKTGSIIQLAFIVLKMIPILFVILIGLLLFSPKNIQGSHEISSQFFKSLPLIIYAMLGFEAACSISNKIENPKKNAPRAIMISYLIVSLILVAFQFLMWTTVGNQLASFTDFRQAFPAFVNHVAMLPGSIQHSAINILHFAIAISALGGGYGILFSNHWNLYTIAQHGHLFFSESFTRLNRYGIPRLCVLAEGIICLLYILVLAGKQVPMQQTGVLGSMIVYMLSAVALIAKNYVQRKNPMQQVIATWAVISSLFLISLTLKDLWENGIQALLLFSAFIVLGLVMFFYNRSRASK